MKGREGDGASQDVPGAQGSSRDRKLGLRMRVRGKVGKLGRLGEMDAVKES
jgi:hypothetical protein